LVGIGADLEPGTLLAAYRSGLFPMRAGANGPLGWWSPDPRGVVPLDGVIVHRSLQKARRRFSVSVDQSFEAVMRGCGDPRRPDGWIDDEFVGAYTRLHELGWAHSLEVWTPGNEGEPDALVGGLYGVAIGGLFAGESMFHRARDASKVALVETVERLRRGGGEVFDVQWCTPHLASLGAVEVRRGAYLAASAASVTRPQLSLA
jgi:leucyl/phenylalanyl-tRNA--protein transferase